MEHSPHWWHLLLPLHQEGNVTLGEQVFPFSPHTLFLLKDHSKSDLPATTGFLLLPLDTCVLLNFSTPITNFTQLLQHPSHCVTINESQRSSIQHTMEQLLHFPHAPVFGNDIEYQLLLLRLLLDVIPLFCNSKERVGGEGRDRVAPILLYIKDNLSEPLNLEQIATHFYVSKPYLCRLFKTSTGVSVMDYIIRCRVEKACQLLIQGYSVQRAGELSGFFDNSHFIRTFGRKMGCPPGKYAKEHSNTLNS